MDGGANGRYLANSDVNQQMRLAVGTQQYTDVEVEFSYRFTGQAMADQSIDFIPMFGRTSGQEELFVSLRATPGGLFLRNRAEVCEGEGEPECLVVLSETPADFSGARNVWYDVLMRVYGDTAHVWVRPAAETLPWAVLKLCSCL